MKALYDFEPKFCPHCGIPAVQERTPLAQWNFRLRNAMTCDCGLSFQKVSTESLDRTAKESEGDLQQIREGDDSHKVKAG